MADMAYDATTLEERAQAALRALDQHHNVGGLYHHVLVDEAQDFPTSALRFAVRLLRPGSDSLLVVADAAQNIYRTSFRWKDAGINALGRTRVLDTSYRNTREILDHAYWFLTKEERVAPGPAPGADDETALIPPRLSSRSGPIPLLLQVGTPQQEVLAIADQCQSFLDRGIAAGDIAVLYGATSIGGFHWPDSIMKAFAGRDLPLLWATDWRDSSKRELIGTDPSRIVLSTIHSAKGLEFSHVVLCGYLDDKPAEESVISRRLIYVGMTRATCELVLTASGNHRYIADLEV
ncbi:MAG: ATP-binding domain-containing protein [Actinomycetota bacterium]|nr:ATP-binding domain-containing protein [Actinomycetota bacterium]